MPSLLSCWLAQRGIQMTAASAILTETSRVTWDRHVAWPLPDSQHSETKIINLFILSCRLLFRWDHFYWSIFNTVFSVIFILLLTFPVNFLSCVLYISVTKLPFVFPLCLLFLCWKFIFYHHFWSVPDCWSIYLLTTLKSFQIFSTAVSFCCWKLLIVFSPASWNCPSFPHGKPFGPVSCKFWMLCYNLPDSL